MQIATAINLLCLLRATEFETKLKLKFSGINRQVQFLKVK